MIRCLFSALISAFMGSGLRILPHIIINCTIDNDLKLKISAYKGCGKQMELSLVIMRSLKVAFVTHVTSL